MSSVSGGSQSADAKLEELLGRIKQMAGKSAATSSSPASMVPPLQRPAAVEPPPVQRPAVVETPPVEVPAVSRARFVKRS
jgi:hypothetical protein